MLRAALVALAALVLMSAGLGDALAARLKAEGKQGRTSADKQKARRGGNGGSTKSKTSSPSKFHLLQRWRTRQSSVGKGNRLKRLKVQTDRVRETSGHVRAYIRHKQKRAARATRPANRRRKLAMAKVTQAVDRVQAKLPERAAQAMESARDVNPLTFMSFLGKEFIVYKVASSLSMNGFNVFQVAQGVHPGVILATKYGVGTVADLGVVIATRHRRRADKSQSIVGTVKTLFRDYRKYAGEQRDIARRRVAIYDSVKQKKSAKQPSSSPASSEPIVTPLPPSGAITRRMGPF